MRLIFSKFSCVYSGLKNRFFENDKKNFPVAFTLAPGLHNDNATTTTTPTDIQTDNLLNHYFEFREPMDIPAEKST